MFDLWFWRGADPSAFGGKFHLLWDFTKIHAQTFIWFSVFTMNKHIHICVYINIYVYIYYLYISLYIYVYTYMYIHIYKYICMWPRAWRAWRRLQWICSEFILATWPLSIHLFQRDSHSPLRNLWYAARICILLWVSNSTGRVRASWRKVSRVRFSWSKRPANVRVFLTQSLNKLRCISFMSVAVGFLKVRNSNRRPSRSSLRQFQEI